MLYRYVYSSLLVEKVRSYFGEEDGDFIASMLWTVLSVGLLLGITLVVFPSVRTDLINFFSSAMSDLKNQFDNLTS